MKPHETGTDNPIDFPVYMKTQDLIDALDARYGNPLAKDCELIQEAIEHLCFMNDEIKACYQHIKDLQEK